MTNGATGQPIGQQIQMAAQQVIPSIQKTAIITNLQRIFQPATDFIRGNPVLSTALVGIGTTGLIAGGAAIRTRRAKPKKKATRKKKSRTTRRRTTRKRSKRKKSKVQIRAMRCRNLKKARRSCKKRRIIRGQGLGTHEIKHSGRSTKGKHKVVSFRNKKTGKMVRFKVRR